MNRVEKEMPQVMDLTAAIVELCRGYPPQMSTFALMQAGAVVIAATGNKSAIANAPSTFQRLINNSVETLEKQYDSQ
jgi:hypothetical protein